MYKSLFVLDLCFRIIKLLSCILKVTAHRQEQSVGVYEDRHDQVDQYIIFSFTINMKNRTNTVGQTQAVFLLATVLSAMCDQY